MPEAITAILSRLARPDLELLAAAAIDLLDGIDGDPDMELEPDNEFEDDDGGELNWPMSTLQVRYYAKRGRFVF